MPETKTFYTHEELLDALQDASPASVAAAGIDLRWLVENDEEQRTIAYHISNVLKTGAKTLKRSAEAVQFAREAREAQKAAIANLDGFTKTLLAMPDIMKQAKAGNLEMLLKTAGSFKVPTDVVLGFLAQAKAAEAPATQAADSAAA